MQDRPRQPKMCFLRGEICRKVGSVRELGVCESVEHMSEGNDVLGFDDQVCSRGSLVLADQLGIRATKSV